MEKYGLLREQLIYEGVFGEQHFFAPPAMAAEDILLTHSEGYWHKLTHLQLSAKEIRNIGFPMTPLLVERGRHIAMGTYMSSVYALDSGVALNIAGGTHHSYKDHGEGFCIFNDIAISANILLDRHFIKRILVVDLDVHQGNGTASIFAEDERVFTLSIHGEKNYPLRKEKSDLDIGLPDGTSDAHYHSILEQALESVLQNFKPEFIFYQAGVDVLKTDKLGRLNLSREGCMKRDRIVLQAAHDRKIPMAITMGGGYSPNLKDILNAHCNTFKVAKEVFE